MTYARQVNQGYEATRLLIETINSLARKKKEKKEKKKQEIRDYTYPVACTLSVHVDISRAKLTIEPSLKKASSLKKYQRKNTK